MATSPCIAPETGFLSPSTDLQFEDTPKGWWPSPRCPSWAGRRPLSTPPGRAAVRLPAAALQMVACFVPESLPQLSRACLEEWHCFDFTALAGAVLAQFVDGEVELSQLQALVHGC